MNAVWNGKEALDYLLEAPSTTRPKPDIILMDCQMPVLDGYRATHLIRHHSPYSAIASIRTLPIVAMTASAIQGDKEKCTQAGMVCTSRSRYEMPSPLPNNATWDTRSAPRIIYSSYSLVVFYISTTSFKDDMLIKEIFRMTTLPSLSEERR